MSSVACSSSTVSDAQIRTCSLVSMEPMLRSMRKLFKIFKEDSESCFDLNALVHELGKEFQLPLGQDTKPRLFHALSKIAERVSQPGSVPGIMLAGKLNDGKMKEEYIEIFNRLSPLATSTSVCPDFWLKTDLDALKNIPVLLIEIVSGSEDIRSTQQTLRKAVCNTIDLMRLYTNFFHLNATSLDMTSIVIPKSGSGKISSAVCVTVRWGGVADWQFHVSFKPIRIDDFAKECTNILSNQFKIITEQVVDLRKQITFIL
jgi:hypothetical protein